MVAVVVGGGRQEGDLDPVARNSPACTDQANATSTPPRLGGGSDTAIPTAPAAHRAEAGGDHAWETALMDDVDDSGVAVRSPAPTHLLGTDGVRVVRRTKEVDIKHLETCSEVSGPSSRVRVTGKAAAAADGLGCIISVVKTWARPEVLVRPPATDVSDQRRT